MKKALVIFGAGKIADAVSDYFSRDSGYEIVAYCVDDAYRKVETFCGLPLLSKEQCIVRFPPAVSEMFVAIGYQAMNDLRATKVIWAKEQGYRLASYRSPLVPGDYRFGENSIVMDGAVIQPRVQLGDDVFVWGGSMIGHHATIGDHCWLTGSCAIGGSVRMGDRCFVGLNATVGNEVALGSRCMVGANTLVNRSLADGCVLVQRDTEIHRLNSSQFGRMSQCFRS